VAGGGARERLLYFFRLRYLVQEQEQGSGGRGAAEGGGRGRTRSVVRESRVTVLQRFKAVVLQCSVLLVEVTV
jgi:hypothetical protein